MPALSPQLSAQIADGVYGIRTQSNVARGFAARSVAGVENSFDFGSATVLSGISGINARSGFGLVMRGTGSRAGELCIVTRGTQTGSDWLSNLNTAAERGPGGLLVHAGFHRIYRSFAGQIADAIRGLNPSRVHCVGHSLGGAMANMVAAQMHADRVGQVELYTFGSARAGMWSFSNGLTQNLGASRIHRVQNMADPVPCVPIYPFRHAPTSNWGIRVESGHGAFSIDAHDMKLYTRLVSGSSWNGLNAASHNVDDLRSVDYWLDQAQRQVSFWGSSVAFYALGMALKGMLSIAYQSLGLTVLGAATVVDRVAWLIMRVAQLTSAMAERVLEFLRLAMRWVGRAGTTTVELTTSFLRYVIELMMRPLISVARSALDRIANL